MADKIINTTPVTIPEPTATSNGLVFQIRQWKDDAGNLKRSVEIVYRHPNETSSAKWETDGKGTQKLGTAADTKITQILGDVLALAKTQMGF